MAKRKGKKKPAEYVAFYSRDKTDDFRNVVCAFVLGETPEQLNKWHEEDRYGLVKRGFHRCTTFKLTVWTRHNGEDLPICGCYENAEWLYMEVQGELEHD